MAGASLLTLIDDIASVLDDVAAMTKLATKKTAGVLGDDLALNAQQVSGVNAERELPVVWAVAKGSAVNKLILVPVALAISALAPWAVVPLLMLGGLFLCYEGFEKLAHHFAHRNEHKHDITAESDTTISDIQDISAYENEKIKGAVRTDFILSAEIITITLGTVATASFMNQVAVLASISIIMTVGVYGFVAGIVKLDDGGLYLIKKTGQSAVAELQRKLGRGILIFAPYMMKTLSVLGTAAMFTVGGGILVHGIPGAEHFLHELVTFGDAGEGASTWLGTILSIIANAVVGVAAGAITLTIVKLATGLFAAVKKPAT